MSAQKSVSQMTLEEVRAERLRTTREYLDLLEEKERELIGAHSTNVASEPEPSADARYTRWPLSDAVVAVLESCAEPQAVKSIAAILKRAGRDFDSDDIVLSVRTALRKAMATNSDIIHVGSAKYHLRSKYRGKPKKLERLMAEANGTGGRTAKEHGRRTRAGIAKRRSEGRGSWGPPIKMTQEKIDRAKEMLRTGATLREVCGTLKVSTATLYAYDIKQRKLKREGQKSSESAAANEAENVVQFAKAQNE